MTNEQLIKSSHFWAFGIILGAVLIAFAGDQTYTHPENSSQNGNANSSRIDNRNANKNSNDMSSSKSNDSRANMATMSTSDRNFVMEAAMGGMMEVEMGRLAAQQGTMDAVKQFGQRMVDDHSRANDELKQVASTKGITLPTELDTKHKNDLAKMSKLSGAEFDKAYSKAMLKDHVKDVAAFEKESQKSSDADIKAFATKTLPTLKEHLEMARAMNGSKNAGSKNGNSNN